MIQIFINNEELDLDVKTLVTFKKSQQLNGIQNQYSYSNNINLDDSPKNRRLLGINYLPNSKAKSMTAGYSCDIVLNGCIFLKKQTLKVQKESKGQIPIYLIFTDNFFTAKAKEISLNQVYLNANYNRTITNFRNKNQSAGILRTAPISAQDASGLVVVEEVNPLLNIEIMMQKVISYLGYNFEGDFFIDVEVKKYYTNANVGVYATDGKPFFDPNLSAYDFVVYVLKTFNAFIDVSDSEKSAGIYLWKNIETIKKNFVDFSDYYTDFAEYTFEGGLSKKNTMAYNSIPDFYNGYFENNKSIVEASEYLKSDFGAGSQRLFDDQEIEENGNILPRVIGETSEPSTLNVYRFESDLSAVSVYYLGVKNDLNMYRAFSPNIYELYTAFHFAYTKNISLPTLGNFEFRYDAIFLARLKMQQVFFIKQLSSYWLPLELNFSTAKDKVSVKSLMIQKTSADVPVIFDTNVSVGFYGIFTIANANALYSALNKSPQSIFVVQNFDTSKNKVFITGSDNTRTEILAFPYTIDIKTKFVLEFENKDPVNKKDSSDLLFQFISEEGGVSRVGKINIQHNGIASYVSEFKSALDTDFTFTRNDVNNFTALVNYSVKENTILNIPVTLLPATNEGAVNDFKVLDFQKKQYVKCILKIGTGIYKCSNQGGKARAETKAQFNLYKNGVFLKTIHSNGAVDDYKTVNLVTTTEIDIEKNHSFNVNAGDEISIGILLSGDERSGGGDMSGEIILRNITWKFECTENL